MYAIGGETSSLSLPLCRVKDIDTHCISSKQALLFHMSPIRKFARFTMQNRIGKNVLNSTQSLNIARHLIDLKTVLASMLVEYSVARLISMPAYRNP